MPGLGKSKTLIENRIYPDLDDAYTALSYSSKLSEESVDWALINSRISEAIKELEKVCKAITLVGMWMPRSIRISLRALADAVKHADIYRANSLLQKLERKLEYSSPIIDSSYNLIMSSRLILAVVFSVLSGILLYYSDNVYSMILNAISLGLVVGGLTLIKSKYYIYTITLAFLTQAIVFVMEKPPLSYGIVLVLLSILFLFQQVESVNLLRSVKYVYEDFEKK